MKHAIALAALVLLNALIKFSLWTEPPQTFTDSLSYIAPATSLLDGRGYGQQEAGYRTPVYPLFLAAIIAPFDHHDLSACREPRVPACLGDIQSEPNADANLRAVVAVQVLLGFLTIIVIYFFAWRVARNYWVAALCALTYPLDLSTGYWEISILADALATFLLALTVTIALIAASATKHRLLAHALLGSSLSALALCQPIYLLYAFVPMAFITIAHRRYTVRKEANPPTRLHRLLEALDLRNAWLVLAIPALAILAWSARNYFVDGFFTPSSLSGYNLTQMVGPFMELAPEQYRDLAEIYVDTRKEREPIRGTHSGTIFFAYSEMLDARKTTWAGLSRDLQDLSVALILKNPKGYFQVARDSFNQFWKFGLGRQNSGVPASYPWVSWFFDAQFQEALTVLFWMLPIGLLLLGGASQESVWVWFAVATVWYVALFSSALNFGDNERYRVPVARLQYSAIGLTIWLLLQRWNVWKSERWSETVK